MPSIPRTIHALWLQGEADLTARKPDLAAILQHNRAHAAASSPAWDLRVWSEEDVMRDSWPRLDPALGERLAPVLASCPSHAARSDILRLVVLLTEGGLYMDTDMMLLSDDFDWLLHSPGAEEGAAQPSLALLYDTSMTRADAWLFGSRGSNCFIAASAGHDFIRALLEEVASAQPFPRRPGDAFPDVSTAARRWTLRTTGPDMLERLLTSPEWWARACAPAGGMRLLPGTLVRLQRSGTSPADWVDPSTPEARRTSALETSVRASNPSAVAIHFSDNSWVSSNMVSLKRGALAVREWAFQNWLVVEIALVLAVVVLAVAAVALLRRLLQTHGQRVASLRRKLSRAQRKAAARRG
jgi:hypothetical protein